MRKIYITLTYTGTILSRIIRVFTGNQYTHASIALDNNMSTMYSFGRLNPYNPFIGGFVEEGINIGTFKRFKNTRTEVYSLDVTEEEYLKIREIILLMLIKRNNYKFNIIGLIYAFFHKPCIRKNKFYCSEFVKYLLENSDVHIQELGNVLKPEDFRKLNILKLEYSGLLRYYEKNDIIKMQEVYEN